MKKKKRLSLVVCALLLFVLAGCQNTGTSSSDKAEKLDPDKIYQDAYKKTNELKNMDMSMDMNMNMAQGEESMDMTISMDMKVTGYKEDKIGYYADMKISAENEELPMTMFYQDGYYYMEIAGQKIKYPYALEDITKEIESSLGTSSVAPDTIKNLSAKKDGDDIILSFDGDASKMNEYIDKSLKMLENLAGTGDVKLDSVSGTCTVGKDGYFSKMDMKLQMSISVEGSSFAINADMNYQVNAIDDDVVISYPEDTSGYIEVDPSLMNLQ